MPHVAFLSITLSLKFSSSISIPHSQIIGGSFISTGQLTSKHARYQFRPHFFQHASFRVVVPEVDLSLYDMTR